MGRVYLFFATADRLQRFGPSVSSFRHQASMATVDVFDVDTKEAADWKQLAPWAQEKGHDPPVVCYIAMVYRW